MLEQTHNGGEIIKKLMSDEKFKKHGKDITKIVPAIIKDGSRMPKVILDQESEFNAVDSAKESLEKEFSCSINVVLSEDSDHSKAKNASPGKVAILVE